MLDGVVGRVKCTLDSPLYSTDDLFNPRRALPIGSSVQITEEVVIRTRLVDPKLVGVDLRYYAPRYYIGNWETQNILFGTGSTTPVEYAKSDRLTGNIWSFNQQITRDRIFTVVGRPDNDRFQTDVSEIDQCNFALKNTIPLPPPFLQLVYDPAFDVSLFKTRTNYSDPPIATSLIATRLDPLFLYLYPGIELEEVRFFAYSEDLFYADVPAAQPANCTLGSDCDSEFDAFIRSNNGGAPINQPNPLTGTSIYSTQSACTAVNGMPCQEIVFTCSNGQVRSYYALDVL